MKRIGSWAFQVRASWFSFVAVAVAGTTTCTPLRPCKSDRDCIGGYCPARFGFCVVDRADAGSGVWSVDAGPSSDSDAGMSDGGGPSDGGSVVVADAGSSLFGHRVLYYRVLPDDLAVPDEDPASTITALVLLNDGGFLEAGIQNLGDGGFRADVPDEGEVYLRIGVDLYVTSAREINLDSYVLGRPRRDASSAYSSIPITVTASGLAPTDFPELGIHTLNTGYYGEASMKTPPSSPVESVSSQPFSLWSGWNDNGELPSSPGDVTYVWQIEDGEPGLLRDAFPDGGAASIFYYTTARRAAEVRGVVLGLDGGVLEVVLTEPSLVSLSTTIKTSDWAPVLAAMSEPHAGSVAKRKFFLSVHPIPWEHGLAYVWPGYSGDLLNLTALEWPVRDLSSTLVFNDGLPRQWLRVVFVSWLSYRTVQFAGGDGGVLNTSAYSAVSDTRPLGGAGDLKPRLWPPRDFRIEGADARDAGELTTQTPLVSWTAPMGASPSGYLLLVDELGLIQGRAQKTRVLVARTDETSVRLPPGVLASGKPYVFTIGAVLCPGNGSAKGPCVLELAVDVAYASVASAAWVVK